MSSSADRARVSEGRRWLTAAAVAVFALSGIACGTRSESDPAAAPWAPGAASDPHSAAPSELGTAGQADPTEPAAGDGTTSGATVPAGASNPGGSPDAPRTGSVAGSIGTPRAAGPGASTPPGAPAPAGSRSSAAAGPGGGRSSSDPNAAAGVPTPTPPGGGGSAQPAPGGPKSPVVLASVGTYSGLPGGTLLPILQGSQLWVKFINARGGLNGHPIQLLVYDDGADPARHRAQVQEAVERRKVVAFLTNAEVLTGKGSVDYITQKRVPVIGSETASPWFYESPLYFPQASSGDSVLLGILGNAARMMLPQGKKKMGSLSCNEAQACRDAERVFAENAEKMGFDYVYRGKASLAQPDFTAECLAARNAGVEAWVIVMETSSVNRIANSCSRQGYKPTLSVPHSTATDEQKENPFLDGLITGSMVFPYFQDTTPATQEFQAAAKSYRANLATGIALATGWVSGKLLERAARNLAEPPTSEALLKNLYTLRNDTLDGLTLPLTFTEGKPPAPLACWFDLIVRNKEWITPDNFSLHCLR